MIDEYEHEHYGNARDLPRFIAIALQEKFEKPVENLSSVLGDALTFKVGVRTEPRYVVPKPDPDAFFVFDLDHRYAPESITPVLVPGENPTWLRVDEAAQRALLKQIDREAPPPAPIAYGFALLMIMRGDKRADHRLAEARDVKVLQIIHRYLDDVYARARRR